MTSFFISDLHLQDQRPQVTEAFFSFLQNEVYGAETLYILGDLFDTWIGDDDDSALATQVATALNATAQRGCKIFFQHGNRDFLLGHRFARRCAMQILPELFRLEVGTECWLLAHGDQFCTQDIAYQQFRTTVRQPSWQKTLLEKSLAERREIAKNLREKSKESMQMKAEDIMDVTPSEINRVLVENKCRKLIHGHTHRPARHSLSLPNQVTAERIVLGEWDQTCWVIRQQGNALELIEKSLI